MKNILLFGTFILLPQTSFYDFPGKYYDHFGNQLILQSDSIYFYSYRFDLLSSWSKGKWTTLKDTVYLENIPIFDTLLTTDTVWRSKALNIYKLKTRKELILSSDQEPNTISINESIINLITGGGQNHFKPPTKLVFKNGRLFYLDQNGRLNRNRVKNILSNKKFHSYYQKV